MKLFRTSLLLLLAGITAVMGYATFVEQAHGSGYAHERVYATPWFFALWAVLALMSGVALWRRRLWRRAAVFALHLSLLIILLGAALTWFTAREGTLHLSQGQTEDRYLAGGHPEQLPFRLRLDTFRIEHYTGTQAPSDFVSEVTILEADGTARQATIAMNHPLASQGHRLCQYSFDSDLGGTVLTVRYDPYGTPVTYLGYALLGLSMLWVLAARRRAGPLAVWLLLMAGWPQSQAQARSIPTISQEKAGRVARMQVVYGGRVCPLSTLAHDFVQKVYGRGSYKGLTAEQVVYGWLSAPEAWQNEPMLKVKDARLRRQLGISGQYATLAQLFDSAGNYRLLPLIEANGGRPDKAMMELDEKAGLILMLTQGSLIQPRPAEAPPLTDTRVSAEILYNTVPFTQVLFMACLTLGFLAFLQVLYESAARRRLTGLARLTIHLTTALFLVHLFAYGLRWYVSGRIPLGNGYETMLFLALMLLLLTLLLRRRAPIVPFGLLLAGFTLLVAHLGQMNPQITPLVPVLSSPLLSAHVSVVMMAYALLAFTFLTALCALAFKGAGRLFRCSFSDDDLESLTRLSQQLLLPAVFLLSAGIFLGAVWANVSWGRYWSWDPKEVWALITLLAYAVPLHRQSLPLLRRPAVYHLYVALAFLCVLMTYFGVNYFLGGMHAYA